MIHFPVAFALLLHVLWWGAGLAMLAMPWGWRRFWPVLVVPAGWALQSAVVGAGARGGLKGTNGYAWWSEVVPVALLVVGVWWVGRGGRVGKGSPASGLLPRAWGRGKGSPASGLLPRRAWVDVQRIGVVWLASECLRKRHSPAMHTDESETLPRPGFRDRLRDFIQATIHPGRVEELAFGQGRVRHGLEMNAARRGVNAKVSGTGPRSALPQSS